MSSDASLRQKSDSSGNTTLSSRSAHRKGAKPIVINVGRPTNTSSVVFFPDGKQFVSAGDGEVLQCWGVEDGKGVGPPIHPESNVLDITVSRDGRWIVCGTWSGWVQVWNAENHNKVTEFAATDKSVRSVDVSPDATKIATGSFDWTVCVWSFSGERLFGPWRHDFPVIAANFSPDGHLIATATWAKSSVRVYDGHTGDLLLDLPVQVNSDFLSWTRDSKQIFAASDDGLHCLDVSTRTMLSKWLIHTTGVVKRVALSSDGAFIAASASNRSVSFWDTKTREQVGSVIHLAHDAWCMALSTNHDLVVSGQGSISLLSLCDILPLSYCNNNMVVYEQHVRLAESQQAHEEKVQSLRAQGESSNDTAPHDTIRNLQKHGETARYHSDALPFDPMNPNDILLKHSNELIEHDPSSYKGYEGKHAALHALGRYSEAFGTFRTMLSKLDQSPDPKTRERRCQYIDATSAIEKEVELAIRHLPRVLINTETGRLYDKTRQAAAFAELPIYNELRSSMTTGLDRPRIQREVGGLYRYVMFSHRWQLGEPTFQQLEDNSVYKLPLSPTFVKLQSFCKLACSLQFKWAWSDTCCINQLDKSVQQESIVAMFRWYRGSSLTIVHLLGVLSEEQEIGRLWRSIWNTRGWTYQEYLASAVVQFYTEDWKPYLGLDVFNHKESPIIIAEMERAMNFATKDLATLRPGLDKVREKLYMASARQTTREEDIAYSLFGIFNVALPVIYGEGNQAVGRLLEHILTRSNDVTLLAWTGLSGSHHSYLPVDLTVYSQIVPPHVPRPVGQVEMDRMLQSSSLDLSHAVALYKQLYNLPPLSLAAGRLRLPGIVFPISDIVVRTQSDFESGLTVYHATTPALGDIEIKTTDELSGVEGLLLIHPWISPLLDRDFSRGVPQFDQDTRALRLVVRLRQSFGALLLAPLAREQYRRIATDCLIMARVREEATLDELMDGIRTVDIQ